jgi:drug/metabolite transporter (DMT)-like permease
VVQRADDRQRDPGRESPLIGRAERPGGAAAVRPESATRTRLLLAFASIYIVWGSTYLAIRFAIETIPPFFVAGSRHVVAGGLLYAWARARGAAPPTRADWGTAAGLGALMLLGGNGAVTWAEQRIPSGLAAVIVATVPLWIVLLEGRRPTPRVAAGLMLGLAGIGLLVGPGELAGAGRVDLLGALVLVGGSLSWAIGSLRGRRAALPASPQVATAAQMLTGGALLLALGLATGEGARLAAAGVSPKSLLAVGYLVVFGSLIGFSAYVWLMRVSTPARVATYAYVNPVVAVALGAAFGGEPLTPRTLLASAVIVTGVVAIVSAPRPK